jgi:DNA-binding NarL/FixJ family response regulator
MIVVEDPFTRELLAVFLETMGFPKVWIVDEASDILITYENAVPKPSVILMDQQLGPRDGLDMLGRLLGTDESARVIIMSREPEAERDCYRVGAVGFIKKPFSLAEVGTAVNKVIRTSVVS